MLGPSGGHPTFIQGSSGVDPRLIQGLPKVAWDDFKAIKLAVRVKNDQQIIKNVNFFNFFFHPQTSFNPILIDFGSENSFF